MKRQPASRRVLLFSQRNIYEKTVWRSAFREFERIIEAIDSVEVIAPRPARWYPLGKRVASRAGEYLRRPLNPGVPSIRLDRDYELFVAVIEKPSELLNLTSVRNRRERCGISICWLTEFYVKDIPTFKSCMEVLATFDHVVFMFAWNAPFLARLSGHGTYLPAGVDALLFSPFPKCPARSIDVLSIGRRAEKTHRELLRLAAEDRIFYVYDTIADLRATNIEDHRLLLASMAKRCKYFIVNPGKIDSPEETGGQSEFGYRYFEGAAPGAVLVGERPKNEEFGKVFDWPDAVIELPFGSAEVEEVLDTLEGDQPRVRAIRTANVVNTLRRHDWAYRWESVLAMAGLAAAEGLIERQAALRQLAAEVERRGID
jgi:hypothetical protein